VSGDFQVGEWSVQPAVNRLTRGVQVVRLEPKVMQVLVCLAENAGEVVTREQLIERVWPDVFVTDDVLHRAIRELRRAFGDSPAAPTYIETIRKRGYRLIPSPLVANRDRQTGTPAVVPATSIPQMPGPASLAPRSVPVSTVRVPRPGGPARSFSFVAGGCAVAILAAVIVVGRRPDDPTPQASARFVPVVSGPLNEGDPAMSPDGRRIAFVQREAGDTATADIYVRDFADGRVTRVTTDAASDRMPAWSPDGSRLAFVRTTATTCNIVIRDLASQMETPLARCGNEHDPRVAWTVDGRALLTSHVPGRGSTSLWRIARLDVSTGATRMVTDPPMGIVGDHSPRVSPDGRHVAFIRRATGSVSDLFVAAIDGTQTRRLTFDEADLTGSDWAADGKSIVYSSDRAGGYSLWRVSIAGTTPVLLAGGAARMKHPVVDRAGRRVVYENWNYEINLWQVHRGANSEMPVTRTSELWNLYPQVSPDGERIAYVSTESGSHQLWIADRDGSNARQMTTAPGGAVTFPRWSPDGRRVLYLARGQGGVDIHYVEVTSGVITAVTASGVNEVAPAWNHDGTRIFFGAPEPDGQWHVRSVGVYAPDDARIEVRNAVAAQPSLDGGAIYFTRPDQRGLWRTTSARPQPECVLDAVDVANMLGWTIAHDGIYFVSAADGSVTLHRVSLNGGVSSVVTPLPRFSWPGFSVTRDGAVLYARWDRRESNLMSIEY
jgi:Tol biopolymer transport system component/DNA-binding winged helix-turn-helix (wHTH) protein